MAKTQLISLSLKWSINSVQENKCRRTANVRMLPRLFSVGWKVFKSNVTITRFGDQAYCVQITLSSILDKSKLGREGSSAKDDEADPRHSGVLMQGRPGFLGIRYTGAF